MSRLTIEEENKNEIEFHVEREKQKEGINLIKIKCGKFRH